MLGTRIRQLRERLGMKQAELGAAIGRSESYISRLETGSIKKPSAESLVKLAQALMVEPSELERAAGYIPTKTDVDKLADDPLVQLVMKAIQAASPERRATIERVLLALIADTTPPPSPDEYI